MSRPDPLRDAPGRSRPAVLAGLTGGLVGATCCIGPAVGVATGAGAGSFLLSLGRYRPILFVIGGIVSFAIAAVLIRSRRAACRTDGEFRALRSSWISAAMVAFAVTYGVGRLVVTRLIERL